MTKAYLRGRSLTVGTTHHTLPLRELKMLVAVQVEPTTTMAQMAALIYGAGADLPDTWGYSLRNCASSLRKKLKPAGWTIVGGHYRAFRLERCAPDIKTRDEKIGAIGTPAGYPPEGVFGTSEKGIGVLKEALADEEFANEVVRRSAERAIKERIK